jgi:hypothetical protein
MDTLLKQNVARWIIVDYLNMNVGFLDEIRKFLNRAVFKGKFIQLQPLIFL